MNSKCTFPHAFVIIFTNGRISLSAWVILMDLIWSFNVRTFKSLNLLALLLPVSEVFLSEESQLFNLLKALKYYRLLP